MSPTVFRTLLRLDYWLADLIGAPAEHTLSGYAYRVEQQGKPWGRVTRPIIDALARLIAGEREHCKHAYDLEVRSITQP